MSIFNKELLIRAVSALTLLPIVLAAIWFEGVYLLALLVVAAILMGREWLRLSGAGFKPLWWLGGVVYIGLPLVSIYWLRGQDNGTMWVFYALFVVFAMDVGGYFAGRLIGGPKLAPKISPKKTWAGLLGGVGLSLAIGYVFHMWGHVGASMSQMLMASALFAVWSQVGDLFESRLKRASGLKDSGGLIPGHGGILDRVDGLVFALPLIAVLYSVLAS